MFQLPGTVRAPRRLLMAHMDTVPICVAAKPHAPGRHGSLGRLEDRPGRGRSRRRGRRPACGVGNHAARAATPAVDLFLADPRRSRFARRRSRALSLLGKPRLAFNWDGGSASKLTVAATGGYRLQIDVEGLAAHAGGAPEQGISAIAIASLAIAQLVREGWHGLIVKGQHQGTSNVGVIRGGEATNVVTDHVELKAEARSHDRRFRKQIVKVIEQAFKDAATQVRNDQGACGRVRIHGRNDYEAFRLADDDPSLLAAERAVRASGLEPQRAVTRRSRCQLDDRPRNSHGHAWLWPDADSHDLGILGYPRVSPCLRYCADFGH